VIKLEMKIINSNMVKETHTDCVGVFESLTFVRHTRVGLAKYNYIIFLCVI